LGEIEHYVPHVSLKGILLERERIYCQGSREGSSRDRRGSHRRKTKEAAAAKQVNSRSSRRSVDRPGRPTEVTQLSVGRLVDCPVDRRIGSVDRPVDRQSGAGCFFLI